MMSNLDQNQLKFDDIQMLDDMLKQLYNNNLNSNGIILPDF